MREKCGRRAPQGEQGYSLIELLIVMIIFAGLLGIIFSVLNTVQLQTRDSLGRNAQTQQAKLGLSQIDRQVRSGNVLTVPGDAAAVAGELSNSLRVYTQTDGVRRCVQWQVYDRTLRYRSWDPDWSLPGGGSIESWRVVARELVDDALITSGEAPDPFTRDASVGSQDQSVTVRLWLQAEEAGGRPIEVSTVLFGRNTVYGYPSDICAPVPPA